MIMRRLREDDGQVMIVILGFAMIVFLLFAFVVSSSRVFLGQRDLAAAADSAAASAAQAVSESAVYGGGSGQDLPLDPIAAEQYVVDYVTVSGLPAHFDRFAIV